MSGQDRQRGVTNPGLRRGARSPSPALWGWPATWVGAGSAWPCSQSGLMVSHWKGPLPAIAPIAPVIDGQVNRDASPHTRSASPGGANCSAICARPRSPVPLPWAQRRPQSVIRKRATSGVPLAPDADSVCAAQVQPRKRGAHNGLFSESEPSERSRGPGVQRWISGPSGRHDQAPRGPARSAQVMGRAIYSAPDASSVPGLPPGRR
jgi:hypothetical protein